MPDSKSRLSSGLQQSPPSEGIAVAMEPAREEMTIDYLVSGKKTAIPQVLMVAIAGLAVCLVLFHLYTSWFSQIEPQAQRLFALSLIMLLTVLLYPLGRKSWKYRLNWWFAIDLVCILAIVANCIYIFWNFEDYIFRSASATTTDLVFGTITLILLLEMVRRTIGWAMVIVAGFLLFSNLFAPYLPGIFYGPPVSWKNTVEGLIIMPYGVYGIPMRVLTGYLILLFLFAALLVRSGGGKFFIEMASSLAGRYQGGPAKVAVVASSFMGTMTGSALANVGVTGSFTIPLMKQTGYEPEFAGAVEACASSGGQLMPPMMGLTAFMIAEFMGVPYIQVCLAAIGPVLIYYVAVFMMVHYEAKRLGLTGMPLELIPRIKAVLAQGWQFLVPIIVLVITLMRGYSLNLCATWAIITLLAMAMMRKQTRMTPSKLLAGMEGGARMAVSIGAACAAAGIIIGTFQVSGLGMRVTDLILTASGGQLWLGLVIAAAVCIVLGMALPTLIVYITVLLIAIPAIIALGAPPMGAHLFCFFFAIISGITPPVALVAFIGGGIAGGNLMKTGITAMRIGGAAYLIPFMFVLGPELIMIGSLAGIALSLVTGVFGAIALAAGLEGYLLRQASWLERLVLVGGGACLMMSGLLTDIVGLAFVALVVFSNKVFPYGRLIPGGARMAPRELGNNE